jgi:hypothetical protein
MKPSSFCTIATHSCAFELVGLLLSLSLFHKNSHIHIMCDNATKDYINQLTPKPQLHISWYLELNEYTHLNRAKMEAMGIFTQFLNSKAKIMLLALTKHKDVLFLDSDIILTNSIEDIDKSMMLGVSKQYLVKPSLEETGYFNAGMLWTKSARVCEDWIKFTKTSRYFEQAAIEDLVKKYSNFKFGEEYNVQCWRYYFNHESAPLENNFTSSYYPSQLLYKNKPLRCVHTHLRDQRFSKFNNLVIGHLNNSKMYSLLAIFYKVLYGAWVIRIPKNQFQDSFRELAVLWGEKISDLKIQKTKDNFCWLSPNILLYDRPTLEWCTSEVKNASLFLLANGNVNGDEGKVIEKKTGMPIKPWIFWPRRPRLLEYFRETNRVKFYHERPVSCIFIGNIENEIQTAYREPFIKEWKNVVQVFECSYGKKHLYTGHQYLEKLQMSKYGLCIRGYGVKCHREIELMALGTVPIVTKDVNTSSYMEPLKEGVHYFKANSPPELMAIVERTNEEVWRKMSNACLDWYMRNVHSSNAWETLITRILFS